MSQLSVTYQNKTSLRFFISGFFMSILPDQNECQEKDSWKVSQKTFLTWNNPSMFVSLPIQLTLPAFKPFMSQNPPLGSCFIWILNFSILKASVDLPRLLWLYVLILHTPLGSIHNQMVTSCHT